MKPAYLLVDTQSGAMETGKMEPPQRAVWWYYLASDSAAA